MFTPILWTLLGEFVLMLVADFGEYAVLDTMRVHQRSDATRRTCMHCTFFQYSNTFASLHLRPIEGHPQMLELVRVAILVGFPVPRCYQYMYFLRVWCSTTAGTQSRYEPMWYHGTKVRSTTTEPHIN
jgi:hypothetical protein